MVKKEQVLLVLKPKVKALGFNKKELESVAETIISNLNLEEDASEEDVNAAIEEHVAAVLPILKVTQSASNRAIEKYRLEHQSDEEDDDEDDNDEEDSNEGSTKKKGGKKRKSTEKQESGFSEEKLKDLLASAVTAATDPLKKELAELKGEKLSQSRLTKLREVLKNTGTYGKTVEKQYSRMSFADDDAFDEYLEEVKEDIKEINQERADHGLDKLGVPPASGGLQKTTEVLTDDELDKMAEEF